MPETQQRGPIESEAILILNGAAVALCRKFLVSLLSRLATTLLRKTNLSYIGKREDPRDEVGANEA